MTVVSTITGNVTGRATGFATRMSDQARIAGSALLFPEFDDLTSMFVGRDGSDGNPAPSDPAGLPLNKAGMGGQTAEAFIASRPNFADDFTNSGNWGTPTQGVTDNGNGTLTVADVGGTDGILSFQTTNSVGDWVYISANITSATATNIVFRERNSAGAGAALGSSSTAGAGAFTAIYKAGYANSNFALQVVTSDTSATIDSFELKVIPNEHLTAPADNQRPVLRKWPVTGRRNLLDSTEDFTQVWDASRVTVTPGYDGTGSLIAKDPVGGTFRYLGQDFTSLASTGENTARFRVKPVVGTQCTLLISGDGAATVHARAVFDTSALTATNIASTNFTDAGVIDNGDGTFDVWITGNLPVVSNCDVYFYPNFYSSTDDGQFVVYKTQVNAGGLSEFQSVTNENDITEAGVPSVYSPVYDGVDDGLTYTFPGGAGPADCSVFFAVKTTDAKFCLLSDTATNYAIIGQDGSALNGVQNVGTPELFVDGVEVVTTSGRDDIHAAISTGGFVLIELRNADFSGWSQVDIAKISNVATFELDGQLIGPIIVETSKLTNALRRTIETYLKRKAGIQ